MFTRPMWKNYLSCCKWNR